MDVRGGERNRSDEAVRQHGTSRASPEWARAWGNRFVPARMAATHASAGEPRCLLDPLFARGLAVFAFAVGSAACGAHRAPDAARPIEMLVANDPETLDPRYATDAVGLRATRLVHAGLVRLDPETLEPRPYVATGWRWRDALTLEVTLRDDVRFHSSGALVHRRDDVAETIRAFASPRINSRHARVVEAIADVREEGERTVVVRLAHPHATLLTDLELPVLRADQAWLPPSPEGTLDGLGPFAVGRIARGEVLLLPASDGAAPRPAHAVTLRTVHDENARALRLEAGAADVALNLVSPTLLPALAAEPQLGVVSRPGANLTYMVVQEQRPRCWAIRGFARRCRSASIGPCSARRFSTIVPSPRVASSLRRTGLTQASHRCRWTSIAGARCSRTQR